MRHHRWRAPAKLAYILSENAMRENKRHPSSNPKPVLLFDLEGTLVDFQWNLQCAASEAKQVLGRLGLDPSTWENHYAVLRNNAVLHAAHKGLNKREVTNCIDAIYDHYDLDAASRWSLMPEVKRLLPYLKEEKRLTLGLVTNVGRKGVERGVTAFGLTGLFDIVVTRNDVELMKPSGEGIRMALERLGARNTDALFVGDSVSDLLAAKDAGVCIAIVQGGESAPTPLIALGPDYLWQDLGELETFYSGGEPTR